MVSIDTSLFGVRSLAIDPHLNFPGFEREIDVSTRRLGLTLLRGNLGNYEILLTDADRVTVQREEYLAAFAAMDAAAQAAVLPFAYVQRDYTPQRPGILGAGAGAGTVQNWRSQDSEYKEFVAAISHLKAIIEDRMGSSLRDEINCLPGGIVSRTPLQLMTHLRGRFNIMPKSTIEQLLLSTKAPISSELSFESEAAAKGILYLQLPVNARLSEYHKLDDLKTSISQFSSLTRALEFYGHSIPDPSAQTFNAAIAFISRHKDSFAPTVRDAGFANQASSNDLATLLARIAVLEATQTVARVSRATNQVTTTKPKHAKWCKHHRTPTHSSAECRSLHPELAAISSV